MNNKRIVELDKYDYNAVLMIINEKRNNLIQEKKDTQYIDEIMQKIIKAPMKSKGIFKREREKCER